MWIMIFITNIVLYITLWDNKSQLLSFFSVYMSSYCGRTLKVEHKKAIRIFPWDPPSQVPPKTKCEVHVHASMPRPPREHSYMVSATFKKMDMSLPSKGKCTTARLDLYDGNTTSSKKQLSGKEWWESGMGQLNDLALRIRKKQLRLTASHHH